MENAICYRLKELKHDFTKDFTCSNEQKYIVGVTTLLTVNLPFINCDKHHIFQILWQLLDVPELTKELQYHAKKLITTMLIHFCWDSIETCSFVDGNGSDASHSMGVPHVQLPFAGQLTG